MGKKWILAVFVATSVSLCWGAPTAIQKLTSKKNAQEQRLKNQSRPSRAQSYFLGNGLRKHGLGLGLGQTFVFGQFRDSGNNQITWDLLYNYSASPSFDFLASFHHSKHYSKERYASLSGLTAGMKAKLFHFDAFSPFAVGGVGFYSPRVKRDQATNIKERTRLLEETEPNVVFGLHAGLGGDLRLNENYTVGIFGQYHNPFDVQQDSGPDVEGSYFKLLITLLYTL